jgi:hypothetical protein
VSGKEFNDVAFVISHKSQLKLFMPIIESVNGSSFIVFHKSSIEDIKLKKRLESKGNIYKQYLDNNNLSQLLDIERVNILITEYIQNVELKDKNPNLRIFYLQHSHDIVSFFPEMVSLESLQKVDKFLVFSDYWKKNFISSLKKKFQSNLNEVQDIKKKTISVGFPEIDQIKNFSKKAIQEKLNINPTKGGIIFFDPIGKVNHVGNVFYGYFFKLHGSLMNKIKMFSKQFIYDIFHHPFQIPRILSLMFKLYSNKQSLINYQSLLKELREYCDQNDALLIVKSREKNNDPDFVKELADYYSYDIEFYPFTLLELLFISDFYIGFNSTTTLEAVACSTNTIQINVCPKEYHYHNYGGGIYNYLDQQLSTEFSWLNYPGTVSIADYDSTVEELLTKIDFKNDESIQKAYINKFLIDLDKNSFRVLNTILK